MTTEYMFDAWGADILKTPANAQVHMVYVDDEDGNNNEWLSQLSGVVVTCTRKAGVKARVADCEEGCLTVDEAIEQIRSGLSDTIYFPADAEEEIDKAGAGLNFYKFGADWDSKPVLPDTWIGKQYASPSNKTSPGPYDISVVDSDWVDVSMQHEEPQPKESETTVAPTPSDPNNEPLSDAADKVTLSAPIVDAIALPGGIGSYLVGADGGVFCDGEAVYWGSIPDLQGGNVYHVGPNGEPVRVENQEKMPPLGAAIATIVAYDNKGYGLVGEDGGKFAFGNFHFKDGSL